MMIEDSTSARMLSALARRTLALLFAAGCLAGLAGRADAGDFALVDLQGATIELDTYREDGRWTLFMIRYHGCGPCNRGERALRRWFAKQDEAEVSVLTLNTDEGDARDKVRERLEYERIEHPNAFTRDTAAVGESYLEITGRPFRAVPSWLLFGPDGRFVDSVIGPEPEWRTLDAMIAAGSADAWASGRSVEPAVESVGIGRSAEDDRADEIVELATTALVRGDMLRARAYLDDALAANPDHHGLLVEKARYLMLEEREAADNPLGYRLSDDTDARVRTMLDDVLDVDETHPRALYLLAELHATQGRLDEAARLLDFPEERDEISRYRPYNRLLLRVMRGEPAEALAGIASFLERPVRGPDRSFMSQQAWARVKSVAIAHPKLDPQPLVREGLITRVDGESLLEMIERRGKGKRPLLIISTSEDSYCSYCVDTGAKIEPWVRANHDKYDIVYTSVEPWGNIAFESWASVVPNALSVPRGILFARSRYMASTGIPVEEAQIEWYEQAYPLMQSASTRLWNPGVREARGELDVAFRRWKAAAGPVSAFASVLTVEDFAWGSANDAAATQAQVDARALETCAEKAIGKGIDEPCTLYAPEAK